MGFNIFTNPLEMHRYFEQQMNEFLKQFQMEDHGNFFGATPEFPMIEELPQGNEHNSGSLRDQYIKPGFEKSKERGNGSRVDTDLDEKFKIADLDKIMKKPENSVVPFQRKQPETRFFGQSVQYKSITNPDGSVEIQKIVRDNRGNEERTITRKIGDKEHTITIKKDKEGREERTEDLINMNMDSPEVGQLWGNRRIQENLQLPETNNRGILSSFLDKFFK